MIPVEIKKLHPDALLPVYGSAHSTCADVHALIAPSSANPLGQGIIIAPGEMSMIPTGLAVRPAPGYATKLHPRSGLALKHGITLKNCTGIIDHDYPDELCVLLWNTGSEGFVVEPGMRIAQLEVHPLVQASFVEVDALSEPVSVEGMAARVGGFGSTGVGGQGWALKPDGGMTFDGRATYSASAQVAGLFRPPVSEEDRSKNIGQAFAMFGELLMECSIESATGITHFAAEEVGSALRMLGQNIIAGHAKCVTHDCEMAHQTAVQAIEALQKV